MAKKAQAATKTRRKSAPAKRRKPATKGTTKVAKPSVRATAVNRTSARGSAKTVKGQGQAAKRRAKAASGSDDVKGFAAITSLSSSILKNYDAAVPTRSIRYRRRIIAAADPDRETC